jgi:hypothetical protein
MLSAISDTITLSDFQLIFNNRGFPNPSESFRILPEICKKSEEKAVDREMNKSPPHQADFLLI